MVVCGERMEKCLAGKKQAQSTQKTLTQKKRLKMMSNYDSKSHELNFFFLLTNLPETRT